MLFSPLSIFLLLMMTLNRVVVWATQTSVVPKGFVTTNGTQFELDGKPFAFVGANSYWLPLLTTQADVESTIRSMQAAGVKVLRTWGFNAVNGSELSGAKESGLTYYQVWNSSQWLLNEGSQGLQRLDNVIETAGRHGIKVILAFTNNWVGYGGMELYINWIVGANTTHDIFYTDPRIISSYQSYVRTIVERYKDSPNIFAWELMNEARCSGDLPSGPACTPASGAESLLHWYRIQSDFVRKLDPHHLITTGGEGHFFWKKPRTYWFDGQLVSDYNWNGQAGEDFDRNLGLPNIDFATYCTASIPSDLVCHFCLMYCTSSSTASLWNIDRERYPELDTPSSNFSVEAWGLEWINDHIKAGDRADKPIVLEEFGVDGLDNKTNIYPTWVQRALDTKHAIMPWQFGALNLTEFGGNRIIKYTDALIDGASPNDGLAIYPNQTTVWDIFTQAAKVQAQRFE